MMTLNFKFGDYEIRETNKSTYELIKWCDYSTNETQCCYTILFWKYNAKESTFDVKVCGERLFEIPEEDIQEVMKMCKITTELLQDEADRVQSIVIYNG